jgi:hypothetical protein
VVVSERECIRCYMRLPLEAFGPHKHGRQGLNGACKSCEVERAQWRKHGMTSLQKSDRADEQEGCAICGRPDPGRKGWVLDHDHACCPNDASCPSCRRAVLCLWCNNALGYAHDNPTILRRMADYLELGTRIAVSDSDLRVRSGNPTDITNAQNEANEDVHRSGNDRIACARIKDSTTGDER